MSLSRQMGLLLASVVVCAWLVATASHAWMSREAAMKQVQAHNDEGAALLAAALSQQVGDVRRMQRAASALFYAGRYRQLRLLSADGEPWFELDEAEPRSHAPRWLVRWFAVDATPGVAPVNDNRTAMGVAELSGQVAGVVDAWWAGCLALAGWLALLGTVALAVSWRLVRGWQRPLEAVVAQARALDEQRFVVAGESKVPELRQLTRSMNSLVNRLQGVFARQAAEVEALRERAHIDAVTGLANRRRFIGQMNAALFAGRRGGAGVLIVRMLDLAAMNRRIGHAGTDRLLAALGEVLQAYPRRVAGALVGRLNGSDFALFLPTSGLAGDCARSLVDALCVSLATVDQGAELVVGGADGLSMSSSGDALALADVALARAVERGGFAIELLGAAADAATAFIGEQQRQQHLVQALAGGRCRLAESPMLDATGRLLHLDCELCLGWQDTQTVHLPPQWRATASRFHLGPQVDLAALSLALASTASDGLPRCMNMSVASLSSAGFVSLVAERLAAAPQQAARLSIDWDMPAALRHSVRLQQASTRWRRLGVQLGLEHVGATVLDLPLLQSLGIDYVKIDAAYVQGVAQDEQVREYARGLAKLLNGMGITVLCAGAIAAEDLAVLWGLGFAGATGPAVGPGLISGHTPEDVRFTALA